MKRIADRIRTFFSFFTNSNKGNAGNALTKCLPFLLTSQAKPYNWSYDTRDDQCKTEILFYKLSCP